MSNVITPVRFNTDLPIPANEPIQKPLTFKGANGAKEKDNKSSAGVNVFKGVFAALAVGAAVLWGVPAIRNKVFNGVSLDSVIQQQSGKIKFSDKIKHTFIKSADFIEDQKTLFKGSLIPVKKWLKKNLFGYIDIHAKKPRV